MDPENDHSDGLQVWGTIPPQSTPRGGRSRSQPMHFKTLKTHDDPDKYQSDGLNGVWGTTPPQSTPRELEITLTLTANALRDFEDTR